MAAPRNMSPEQRIERARKARAAQSTTDYYIQKLVESAPPLTAEQIEVLRRLLPSPKGAVR